MRPIGTAVLVAAALAAAALLLSACEREDEGELPAACRSGPDAIRAALESAPADVRVEGTPLSGCLVRTSEAGDLLLVGQSYLLVATALAREARDAPHGDAVLRLGYLIGAVRRGAHDTQGIHEEMVRRLEQELLRIDTRAPAFLRGERAGRESG